jgi:hypothetical protein
MSSGRHLWLALIGAMAACGSSADAVTAGAGGTGGNAGVAGTGGRSAAGGGGSGPTDASATPLVCVPGHIDGCACPYAGVDGVRYCNSDGTGYYGDCMCSTPPWAAGGAGGGSAVGGAGGGSAVGGGGGGSSNAPLCQPWSPQGDAGRTVDAGLDADAAVDADAGLDADAGVTVIATLKARDAQPAQDDAAIYWIDRDISAGAWEIDKYAKADGTVTKIFGDTQPVWSLRLVVAGGYVYYWTSSGVRRVSTAGGAASPPLVYGYAAYEPVFTATDAWVYALSYSAPSDSLNRASAVDGGAAPSVQLPSPWWGANGLGADSQNVYIATNGYYCPGGCTPESAILNAPAVFAVPHGGSAVTRLMDLPAGSTSVGPASVVSNGDVVCVTLGGVTCRSLAGASQIQIGEAAQGAIALDATHVYFAGRGLYTGPLSNDVCHATGLWRAGVSGEKPSLLATGPSKASDGSTNSVGGVIVDDQYVYWTSGTQLLRMRKSP